MFQKGGIFLLNYSSGADPAVDQAPVPYRFLSSSNEAENQSMQFNVYVVQAGGSGSQTLSVILEVSPDGVTWIPLFQIQTNSTTTSYNTSNQGAGWPFVRASLTAAGTVKPSAVARVYAGWAGQITASAA